MSTPTIPTTSTTPPTSTTPQTPNPPTTPPSPPLPRPLLYTLLLSAPLLALLPPRKLDLYTFSLTGVFALSAQELYFGPQRRQTQPRTGSTGVMGVLGSAQMDAGEVVRGQSAEVREREGRLRPGFPVVGVGEGGGGGVGSELGGRGEGGEGEGQGITGMARRLWMGDERPGWQRRRMEKEREALEAGKSYGDIIMEQVREVFPAFGGRKRGEGGEEE